MNVVYQSLGLLLLVTGALSAAITNLGGKCTIGDTCSVNGAVCDKASLTCQCQFGYVQSGDICSRHHLAVCGDGMCKDWTTMTCDSATSKCACDASQGYTASGGSCTCPSGSSYSTASGACKKFYGTACAAGECHPGLTCSGSPTTCACDTTLHYGAGTGGATTCSCDAVAKYIMDTATGLCKLMNGETCSSNDQCLSTMICDIGGTGKCTCDTTKNYGAGTAASTTCTCDATAKYIMDTNGACKKMNGEACTASDQCLSTMICDIGGTGKCTCDTTKKYAAGIPADTTCACDSTAGYTNTTATGDCKLVIGETCTPASSQCHPNLVCAGTSGQETCQCDTAQHFTTGTPGLTTCTTCAANYALDSNGACKKVNGQTCSSGECHPNLICSTTCKCDSSKQYTGTTGTVTCTCSTGYSMESDGTCKKVIGQTCSSTSDCYHTLVCTGSTTTTCQCDTTKNFIAGATTISCACATGYTYSSFYGKCAINLGGTCSRNEGTFVPCIENAVCDRETDTCACDSAAGFAVSGTTCGACKTGYTMVSGRCVADLDGFCIPSATSGVCVSGATCFAGNSSTTPQCLCDSNQYDYKLSCSGAGGVVASLAGLLMALFMTSRLM